MLSTTLSWGVRGVDVRRFEVADGGVTLGEVGTVQGSEVIEGFVGDEHDVEVDLLSDRKPVEVLKDGCGSG